MHIAVGRPAFADIFQKGIKIFFGEDEMEQRNARVDFDREETIGGCQESRATDAPEFAEEAYLLGVVSDMLADGIGLSDIKMIVLKW